MSEGWAIALFSGAIALLTLAVTITGYILGIIRQDLDEHKKEYRQTANSFLVLKTQHEDFVKLYTAHLANLAHCPDNRFGLDRDIDEFLFLIYQYKNPTYDIPDWQKLRDSAVHLAEKCEQALADHQPTEKPDLKLKYVECLSETLRQLVVNLCEHKMARDGQTPTPKLT